ncbi:hypothetical protein FQA39_LY13650 [Lamprigera yunnana]|nr:hypothetical protein FQA39_LY13650 [Lamprigera yunnana]
MANADAISLLIRKRGELAANLDIRSNVNELLIRQSKFEQVWEEFEKVQIEIESLVADDKLVDQYEVRDWYIDN